MQVPEPILITLRLILAAICAAIGFRNMGAGGLSFPVALGFFGVAALLVAHPIANAIAGHFVGNGLGDQAPELPRLSRIQGLIAQREFATARAELEALLRREPGLLAARVLLLRLLYVHLHQPETALAVALAELEDAHWRPEEEQIAGMAVDILLELDRRAEAVACSSACCPKPVAAPPSPPSANASTPSPPRQPPKRPLAARVARW